MDSRQKTPRGIVFRRGEAEDELSTFDVMRRSMNAEMSWANHSAMRHHLRNSPNCSFWVAEDTPRFGSPRIVGYARAVVRDAVWSLTEFFVTPSQHRQGVGGTLLSRCIQDGERAGADTRLVLASHHPDADSLYIRRAGCFPRLPMMLLSGPATTLIDPAPGKLPIEDSTIIGYHADRTNSASEDDPRIIASTLVLNGGIQEELDALDREIVGYARPTEHRFWAEQMGGDRGAARIFRSARQDGSAPIIGYSYIGSACSGPTVTLNPAHQSRFYYHVSGIARQVYRSSFDLTGGLLSASEQYCALAGINEVMLQWLLASGWQIVFQYLFTCTRTLGKMDSYVCHNPLYVL